MTVPFLPVRRQERRSGPTRLSQVLVVQTSLRPVLQGEPCVVLSEKGTSSQWSPSVRRTSTSLNLPGPYSVLTHSYPRFR